MNTRYSIPQLLYHVFIHFNLNSLLQICYILPLELEVSIMTKNYEKQIGLPFHFNFQLISFKHLIDLCLLGFIKENFKEEEKWQPSTASKCCFWELNGALVELIQGIPFLNSYIIIDINFNLKKLLKFLYSTTLNWKILKMKTMDKNRSDFLFISISNEFLLNNS